MSRRISGQACSSYDRISKKTVKAMFPVGTKTRQWLDSLQDDQWQVTSFDPKIRVVCFDLVNPVGIYHLSLTLPDASGKLWS